MSHSIKLQAESVLQVPFDSYQKDFTFVVNNEIFPTTKFCADLLSTKISNIHQADPTMNEYCINTKSSGNFQHILDLLKSNEQLIQDEEIPFFSEIISQLSPSKINVNIQPPDMNLKSVIDVIHTQEQSPFFYSKSLTAEIEYVSSHFYELGEEEKNKMAELTIETIKRIICSDKLELDTEDQLLTFINGLYSKSSEYSELYEFVYFKHASDEKIGEFLSLFDTEDMTRETWKSISKRLFSD